MSYTYKAYRDFQDTENHFTIEVIGSNRYLKIGNLSSENQRFVESLIAGGFIGYHQDVSDPDEPEHLVERSYSRVLSAWDATNQRVEIGEPTENENTTLGRDLVIEDEYVLLFTQARSGEYGLSVFISYSEYGDVTPTPAIFEKQEFQVDGYLGVSDEDSAEYLRDVLLSDMNTLVVIDNGITNYLITVFQNRQNATYFNRITREFRKTTDAGLTWITVPISDEALANNTDAVLLTQTTEAAILVYFANTYDSTNTYYFYDGEIIQEITNYAPATAPEWHETLTHQDKYIRFGRGLTRPAEDSDVWSIGRKFVGDG